jgi:membrane-bound lytic murein transglycosylase D
MLKISLFFFFSVFRLAAIGFAPLAEATDSISLGAEGSILTVMPPLKFTVDDRLQRNVDFWIRIYSQFSSHEGLIHDAKYIDHIYRVVDFRHSGEKNSHIVQREKNKIRALLLSIHQKQSTPDKMTDEEKRVFELFSDVTEPNKFLNAAHRKRLRFQLGQKDRFLDGFFQSGRYLAQMEAIFKREGMPTELTRLPFVESSFNIKARSKVGASGIWQFMRSTASLFIQVNDAVDERNDPIRATEAAAKLLRVNYESLRSWPLAVTAYNHGRKGMMRAVRRVGSDDLETLVSEYHSRSFGFASGNFFPELLACIEVEKNAEKYFGKIDRAPASEYFETKLPDYIQIQELIRWFKLDPRTVKELNPALSEEVLAGRLLVPSGYILRIPYFTDVPRDLTSKHFTDLYALIPANLKLRAQRTTKYGTRGRSFKHQAKI